MTNWLGVSREHIKSFPHLLTQNERRAFLVFFAVALVSLVGIFIVLDRSYSVTLPADGGALNEGLVGRPLKLNPLTAVSDADRDLVSLLYAGIVRPDGKGGYTPELAESLDISSDGLSYTAHLRQNLEFHDGEPLTADDVVFTVETVKNAAIASPLRANWEGVEVEKVDDATVTFRLKKAYAPFIASLSLGILPKHIWGTLSPQQFTVSERNLASPVGAGPYRFSSLKQESSALIGSITLSAFRNYALGRPHLDKIVLSFFDTESDLASALKNGAVTSGIVGKTGAEKLESSTNVRHIATSLVYALFFNTDRAPVLADVKVREALDLAIDRDAVIAATPAGSASRITGPLPIAVASVPRDLDKARALLKSAGWTYDDDAKTWTKKVKSTTETLTFNIATSNNEELIRVANAIATSLKDIGVNVTLSFFERADLEQARLRPRDFESLLFGQVLGVPEDPYAFWHSSQRTDPGLNVAKYANPKADALSEKLRTPLSPEAFTTASVAFNTMVAADHPALFLYSPVHIYVLPKTIEGAVLEHAGIRADRFANIREWYIEREKVWKFLARSN